MTVKSIRFVYIRDIRTLPNILTKGDGLYKLKKDLKEE